MTPFAQLALGIWVVGFALWACTFTDWEKWRKK